MSEANTDGSGRRERSDRSPLGRREGGGRGTSDFSGLSERSEQPRPSEPPPPDRAKPTPREGTQKAWRRESAGGGGGHGGRAARGGPRKTDLRAKRAPMASKRSIKRIREHREQRSERNDIAQACIIWRQRPEGARCPEGRVSGGAGMSECERSERSDQRSPPFSPSARPRVDLRQPCERAERASPRERSDRGLTRRVVTEFNRLRLFGVAGKPTEFTSVILYAGGTLYSDPMSIADSSKLVFGLIPAIVNPRSLRIGIVLSPPIVSICCIHSPKVNPVMPLK